MSQEPNRSFIIDANVLIDYCDSELDILSMYSQHVGDVYIARSTFNKVKQLKESQAEKYHLNIMTPDSDIITAAARSRGPLAYDDHETLLLAKANGLTCITNDKTLRRECKIEGVPNLWGLEPMKALVRRGVLARSKALIIAGKIQAKNPGFITDEIIKRFESEIKEIHAGKE